MTQSFRLSRQPAAQTPRLLLLGQAERDDLASTLAQSEQIAFVGAAPTVDEALHLVEALQPDLVLVDLDEESLRADRAVEQTRALPGIVVVGMTRSAKAPWVGEAVRSGVDAVVNLSEEGGKHLVADVSALAASLGAPPREDQPTDDRS